MPKIAIDHTGKRFNKLLVLKFEYSSGRNRYYKVHCDCGIEKVVATSFFTNKKNKSCGCHRMKKGPAHNAFRGVGQLGSSFISIIKSRAKFKRIDISDDLTLEFLWELNIKQDGKCALTGDSLIWPENYHAGWQKKTNASLDRIDSSLGYIPTNVQWVTKNVNFMKQELSQQVFIETCSKVVKNFIGKL